MKEKIYQLKAIQCNNYNNNLLYYNSRGEINSVIL